MIDKVSNSLDKRCSSPFLYKSQKNNENQLNYLSIPENNSSKRYNPAFYIPFTAKTTVQSHNKSKLNDILYNSDTSTKNTLSLLQKNLKGTGYTHITTLHVIKHELTELNKFIDCLDKGEKDINIDDMPPVAEFFSQMCSKVMFSNPELRKAIKPVITSNIEKLDGLLKENVPETKSSSNGNSINLSEDLTDSIWALKEEDIPIDEYTLFTAAMSSQDEVTDNFSKNLLLDLKKYIMIDNRALKNRSPFSDYNKKAENVLKNLSLGTNMFITFDQTKETPDSFIDTIYKLHQQDYSNKSTFTQLSSYATSDYFIYMVNKLAKDKTKEHIIAANPLHLILQESKETDGAYTVSPAFVNTLFNHPSNVKFLFYDAKDSYYVNFSKICSEFQEISIPSLDTPQMVKMFRENPVLMKDLQKQFTRKAADKVVEASALMDGVFPDKTINLMKKIVSYYIDKPEITESDVSVYLSEASDLFKKNDEGSSVNVVFDTGVKLNNLIGKESTKQEASAIVKQIKSGKLGTKGIIIFSQDGSPGSGRRYTAKAIAGEANIPYIEVNTMDFGTKEVELFGGGALSPEASIKKLFSIVTGQAEANVRKSAVLFIDNFEYFSVGEYVSLYHQKAMAQLLREMEKADKAGLNILVVGSVADPHLIGNAAMKSFKFIDLVSVASPAYDPEARAEILNGVLKSSNIKIAGDAKQQKNTIEAIASFTSGFPFIYLKNLVKKAQSVAIERGHKNPDKSDFIEAYLQITTGRPAVKKIAQHEKEIVTSHECGHATNLEVMNNIAKTIGKPWHIPDKVSFITLDPRGLYGGAVYHSKDVNSEESFEKIFSSIVCSFGGNSAENYFYGMNGSYGISGDMESVRYYADLMVKVMGLGAKTGKMAISDEDDLSDKMKSIIEDDERVIINNAKIVSDLITEIYGDFNKEFTEKYSSYVGTGDCLLDGDKFRNMLQAWKKAQSKEKQEELELCDKTILRIIDCTKKGVAVRKE